MLGRPPWFSSAAADADFVALLNSDQFGAFGCLFGAGCGIILVLGVGDGWDLFVVVFGGLAGARQRSGVNMGMSF
jgi:hypothetical protein